MPAGLVLKLSENPRGGLLRPLGRVNREAVCGEVMPFGDSGNEPPPECRPGRQPAFKLASIAADAFDVHEPRGVTVGDLPQLLLKRGFGDSFNNYRFTCGEMTLNVCHENASGTSLNYAKPPMPYAKADGIDDACEPACREPGLIARKRGCTKLRSELGHKRRLADRRQPRHEND